MRKGIPPEKEKETMKTGHGLTKSGMMALLVGALAAGAEARGEAVAGVSVDVAVLSAYVWRGQVLNKDAVLQPGLTGSIGGFTANAWSSMNLAGTETDGEFTEFDWTVAYSREVGPVELAAGVVQYTFPNSTVAGEDGSGAAYPGTVELFATAGMPGLPLGPSLGAYWDVDEIDGFYAVASIGHAFGLTEKATLELSASLGIGDKEYNEGYFGHGEAALNDLLLVARLPIEVGKNATLAPTIGYAALPDTELGDAAKEAYGEKEHWFGGVALGLSF